jgi:hypothetical protein
MKLWIIFVRIIAVVSCQAVDYRQTGGKERQGKQMYVGTANIIPSSCLFMYALVVCVGGGQQKWSRKSALV